METRKAFRHKQKIKFYSLLGGIICLVLILGGVFYIKINNRTISQDITHEVTNTLTNTIDKKTMKSKQKLNVPIENQYPDLPNGCEVTSLSMLLNYYHVNVTKDDLAQNIQHVAINNPDGTRGNPNMGFVGSMTQSDGGWCVFNGPLYDVARRYTHRIRNATNDSFDQIMQLVSDGHPVMIITTLSFTHVLDMQTWNTDEGTVNVTPSSHACVITGYNKAQKIVYVNDPFGIKDKKVSWSGIKASYIQQGKQALYMK